KKVYVTVNIFAHNRDLPSLPSYLHSLSSLGVDGIIVSDPGVFQIARKTQPQIPIHISTQANVTNLASVQFWEELGANRVVLGRELSLEEIKEIRLSSSLELESFIHGAMCLAYSGRCFLSSYLTGRSANRGACTHPCRWQYYLMEEKRPGQYLPVLEDSLGTSIMSSPDLCLIRQLPELIDAGLNSWKIEGRMKSIHYVATVTKTYRQALDLYWGNPEDYDFKESWWGELEKTADRGFTTGFYFGQPDREKQWKGEHQWEFAGVVLCYDHCRQKALVEQRNRFSREDVLEVFGPNTPKKMFSLDYLENERGERISSAPHPQQKVWINVPGEVEAYSMIRRLQSVE
ncbi:MAG TPA: U32 family peptidase, partial [Clostridia bacterium]|nr:U32 family peptidase [Clostridia bacterium]